jgi:peptidoglycan/LPS O-acetylase OafA/YrhL
MMRAPAVDHRANNFDFLRFVAASLVLYSHCFALTGMGGYEPLTRITHGDYVFAGLAVRVFFVISGYLVMQSWMRQPRLVPFAVARCLRIFPGLAVALLYCVGIGASVTTLSSAEYWANPETYGFLWRNLLLQVEFFLPGAFENNAFPRAVNGSVWSLYFEFRAYLVVAFLGVVGAFSRRWLGTLAWVAMASLIFFWREVWGIEVDQDWPVVNLFVCFVGGALAALYPGALRAFGLIAALATVAFVLMVGSRFADVAIDAGLIAGALWFAHRRAPLLARFGRYGDFSYGVFIYAFPTQQMIAWMTDMRSPYLMLAVSFPATVMLAAVSWHLIERPSLALKRYLVSPGVVAPLAIAGDWSAATVRRAKGAVIRLFSVE